MRKSRAARLACKRVALLALLLGSGAAGGAWADCRPDNGGFGGGGEVPTPFQNSNRKVELADGELYTLIGTVRIHGGIAYLEIDLAQHAWLGSARRKAMPYYELAEPKRFWRPFEGKRVKLFVESRTRFRVLPTEIENAITLKSMAAPAVLD